MVPQIAISLPDEVWKDIEGYKGLYQVSNLGRVKNVSSATHTLLRQGCVKGYHNVCLSDGGNRKTVQVHTLVADAFLGIRPDGYEVSHIDENGFNNCVSNLEYASHVENCRMPQRSIRISEALKGKPQPWNQSCRNGMARPVVQYTKNGEKVTEFGCIRDAERSTGIMETSIANCLAGRSKSAGGYRWSYK